MAILPYHRERMGIALVPGTQRAIKAVGLEHDDPTHCLDPTNLRSAIFGCCGFGDSHPSHGSQHSSDTLRMSRDVAIARQMSGSDGSCL
jgi:hypothetical protein